ncbi:hypothetical protein G6F64_015019 [Rhizopus arrhizus]|uniref:Uncharacterized protein n=1 Tax=Rhizopus oryzae TaxID=64495 RepID=A0A9P7BI75_RHIOR|nr:hypothetical protein G6F64_015019 [Rhizopus arrhizus]
MPFVKTGLSAASVLPLRSPGVLKLMSILNLIGVNRQGFSLLLCSRIYATFVRPKFEYGLAISKFTIAQVVMPPPLHPSSSISLLCHLCTTA